MILLFDGVGTCFRSVALAVNFLCREVAGAHDFIEQGVAELAVAIEELRMNELF